MIQALQNYYTRCIYSSTLYLNSVSTSLHPMPRTEASISPFLSNSGPFVDSEFVPSGKQLIEKVAESKILVIGAGGLGCEILKNLCFSGFRNIHIIDMDTVEISNLNRQFLFRATDVGRSKAEVAAARLKKMMPFCEIEALFCKIQDQSISFYKQFSLVICGLDSVEARRWINATLVNMVDENDFESLKPLIDGGSEGFRGQSRVIIPTITACYECSLDMLGKETTYPVCTIANTPRLPEHCIQWASQIEWPESFPDTAFDADNPDHVDWLYEKSKKRADYFHIQGVTRSLSLGVVKNIIPSIASTNSIIAASCCNEVFKIITSCNPILETYMMYSGDDSIFTYTFNHEKRPDCPVCGNLSKEITVQKQWTLQVLIEELMESEQVQMKRPSLRTSTKNLFMQSPDQLRKLTEPNLTELVINLVDEGEEVILTDPALPLALKFRFRFTSHQQ